MLYFFPRRYDDYSQMKPINRLWYGDQVTVIGMVQSISGRPVRGGKMQIVEVVLSDGTGALRLTFFNQPWITNRLKEDMSISVSGKIEQYLGRLVMNNPEWEPVEVENLHTNRIVPIYPLTADITQKWLRKQMNQVVTFWAPRAVDPLPQTVKESAKLLELGEALAQAHFPDSQEKLKAARERLAFDEIFYLQMGVLRQKRDWQSATARVFEVGDDWLSARVAALPYELTGAQQRVIGNLRDDLKAGTADEPPAAGRCRFRQDDRRCAGCGDGQSGWGAGGHHGADVHPRRAALPQLPGAAHPGSGRGRLPASGPGAAADR